MVLEKTLERRSNQSILKEISPGISLEGMMLKLKLQYSGHLMRRNLTHAKEILLIHIITCADTQSAKQTEILITAGPLTDSTAQNKGLLGKPYADQKVRTELSARSKQDAPRKEGTPTTLSPAARSLKSALGLLGKALKSSGSSSHQRPCHPNTAPD